MIAGKRGCLLPVVLSSIAGCGGDFDLGGNTSFVEDSAPQKIATDALFEDGGFSTPSHNPEFGDNKIFLAYMDNTPSPMRNIVAKQYDYATGKWTSRVVATMDDRVGNVGGNTPSLYRDRQGYIEVFYGANTCSLKDDLMTPDDSPCYRRSLRPNDISEWGPVLRVPGGGPEPGGPGYAPDNSFHLFGCLHAELSQFRRDISGAWGSAPIVRNSSGNNLHAPCMGDRRIVDDIFHITWSPLLPPFNGSADGIYYARSHDQGETWTNVAGTASFSRGAGLGQTVPGEYPSSYLVRNDVATAERRVNALRDGTVLIADGYPTTVLRQYRAGAWQMTEVSPAAALGLALEVTANDEILIFQIDINDSNLYELYSRNRGASWTKTLLYQREAEDNNKQLVSLQVFPRGRKGRVILAWNQTFRESPPHVDIMVLDRPLP